MSTGHVEFVVALAAEALLVVQQEETLLGGALQGVYFAESDYVGAWKRLVITLVDAVVAFVATVLLASTTDALVDGAESLYPCAGLVALGYLVLAKRSASRTVGYRLFKARIVALTGSAPSIPQMVQRLAFVLLGPINYLMDPILLREDADRQTLRDVVAGTYVVKEGAVPAGWGAITYARYPMGGFGSHMLVRKVRRESGPST